MTAAPVVSIVPVTIALLDSEASGPEQLCLALHVELPPVWPPEFNGEPYRQWQRNLLGQWPDEPGYAGYYVIGDGELVGTCGFKGPPGESGMVEIGYSIVPPRRRRRYASSAVKLLLDKAFADRRVALVVAETRPDGTASQGVLRRCGFQPVGTRLDDADGLVMRFERRHPG
jgi:RimJ/RimL family protein N-acetyltransferase